ncbi:hypothetical protein CC86DRAFT_57847 [Ophiobolus disseminans]|uniref:Uncharacterized protein n=1 Tax=Ophiobolus disseminans TaxID=1469910 RepID=A0A6A6ZRA8_9PLEO|nr:hypothetical protein CC86DRAFT_57847 [Ophiobolus disseminans]
MEDKKLWLYPAGIVILGVMGVIVSVLWPPREVSGCAMKKWSWSLVREWSLRVARVILRENELVHKLCCGEVLIVLYRNGEAVDVDSVLMI